MLSLVFLIAFADVGLAYYCDHNLCHAADEYCCGDNLCCEYANSSSYFWISILVLLLVLALLWALVSLFCLPLLLRQRHHFKHLVSRLLHSDSMPQSAWNEDTESCLMHGNGRGVGQDAAVRVQDCDPASKTDLYRQSRHSDEKDRSLVPHK